MRNRSTSSSPMLKVVSQNEFPLPENALATMERRLADGYLRIEQARMQGQDIAAWEDFWIDLLHQYESMVDDLPEAA